MDCVVFFNFKCVDLFCFVTKYSTRQSRSVVTIITSRDFKGFNHRYSKQCSLVCTPIALFLRKMIINLLALQRLRYHYYIKYVSFLRMAMFKLWYCGMVTFTTKILLHTYSYGMQLVLGLLQLHI